MLAIRRLLNSCVLVDCEQSEISDSNKENTVRAVDVRRRQVSPAPATLQLWLSPRQAEPQLGRDTATVARLLEILVILWRSVQKALRQNEEAEKYTAVKFGSVLVKYFQALEVLAQLGCFFCSSLFLVIEAWLVCFPE